MDDLNNTIKKLNAESTELSDVNWTEYLDYITAHPDDNLMQLLKEEEADKFIEELTLDQLLHLPFNKAHQLIVTFNMSKRIGVLGQIDTYRDYLYTQISKYGSKDVAKEDQMGPKDFRLLLGKIKHIEIVQNWLFGIV